MRVMFEIIATGDASHLARSGKSPEDFAVSLEGSPVLVLREDGELVPARLPLTDDDQAPLRVVRCLLSDDGRRAVFESMPHDNVPPFAKACLRPRGATVFLLDGDGRFVATTMPDDIFAVQKHALLRRTTVA